MMDASMRHPSLLGLALIAGCAGAPAPSPERPEPRALTALPRFGRAKTCEEQRCGVKLPERSAKPRQGPERPAPFKRVTATGLRNDVPPVQADRAPAPEASRPIRDYGSPTRETHSLDSGRSATVPSESMAPSHR
jgi:hypothetical protein